jgi:ArsR family transcriptional regulator
MSEHTKAGLPPACCSLDIEADDQARFLGMLKAAGNPTRFEVLKFLVTHPGCITGAIVDHLPIAQATVSQHLKVLKDSGWVRGEIEGAATCYQLDSEKIAWFKAQVDRIF